MSDLIQKILDDRAVIRAFSDEQIEVLRTVLAQHLGTAAPAAPAAQPVAAEPYAFPCAEGDSYDVYVDGSCSGNPGPGGWSAWFPHADYSVVGGDDHTTNNRMEILAAARGIAATPQGSSVSVYTDSQLVKRTMDGEYAKKTNVDLWDELDAACKGRNVVFYWVKGHDKNAGNNKADALAQGETARRKDALKRAAIKAA